MAIDWSLAQNDTVGDIQQANNFTNQLFDRATQRRAGNQYADGNRRDAAKTLARGGDIRGASIIEGQEADSQIAQFDRQQKFIKQAAPVFRAAAQRGPEELLKAFDMLSPDFEALGTPPDQIARYRQGFQQDPQAMLSYIDQAAQIKPRFEKSGNTVIVFDEGTGKELGRYAASQYQTVGEGQQLVEIPGMGSQSQAAPQAVFGQPSAQAPKPQQAQTPSNAPRGIRNNNPGNIRASGDQWQGMTGTDQGGFVQFDTPQNGRRALERNLQTYAQNYGLNTVEGIINRWAPPSENPTGAYVNAVAQRLGVPPGQPLNMQDPQVIGSLADAITAFENGPQSASGAPEAQAQPGARVIAQGTPKPREQWEQLPDGRQRNTMTGKIEGTERGGQGDRKAEADLRKEFNARQEVKDFRTVDSAYRSVQAAAKNPSAAGDLSLIFAYMKLLDPGSVVREQEFANAQNAAGVPDRVRNLYNKALNGQRLNPNQRNDFINQAGSLYGTRRSRFDEIANEYRGYADDYGISADRIVTQGSGQASQAPVEGARQGQDGGWYIEDPNRKGSFPQVTKGPNGRWRIKSANGQMLEWQ